MIIIDPVASTAVTDMQNAAFECSTIKYEYLSLSIKYSVIMCSENDWESFVKDTAYTIYGKIEGAIQPNNASTKIQF